MRPSAVDIVRNTIRPTSLVHSFSAIEKLEREYPIRANHIALGETEMRNTRLPNPIDRSIVARVVGPINKLTSSADCHLRVGKRAKDHRCVWRSRIVRSEHERLVQLVSSFVEPHRDTARRKRTSGAHETYHVARVSKCAERHIALTATAVITCRGYVVFGDGLHRTSSGTRATGTQSQRRKHYNCAQ